MIKVMRQSGDKDGEEMWKYVLHCLGKLQHEGMSDEEDSAQTANIEGHQIVTQIRKVLQLPWRHPSFRNLFKMVDETREVEATIFSHRGRPPMSRVRVDEKPSQIRSPPKHLPQSFFNQQYLQDLSKYPWQLDELKMSSTDFPLREINFLPDFEETEGSG
ncbi:hypothetical protein K435DRAFT_659685 [Dendrothele bispora CBS 962.96]|uniref:Uncharacterized protein n=1 Tax=Dendrothele bispora (strain CBS 962.96) TaxID=1314807 RepID=A0A4V4HGJ2_DENBC|nr:hypothetical protein K435DRAFT_659685 [Dendrothele bispora CBS 962.96]